MCLRSHGEDGQALVEAAIVLPLWIALFLCTLQLVLLGQARLLAEYAAYQGARTGVVWSADPRRMQQAATFVLAPTACPTQIPSARPLCKMGETSEQGSLWRRQAAGIAALQHHSADAALGFPGVHVHILNPHWESHGHLFEEGSQELDFDSFPTDLHRDATLLTIQLQYWLELKIPFANWIVWTAWVAARGGISLLGALPDPSLRSDGATAPSILDHGETERELGYVSALATPPKGEEANRRQNYAHVSPGAWRAMLALGLARGERGSRAFFIPVIAHHTMRMQSNLFAQTIRGCSCEENRGCTETCRAW